MTLIRIRRLRRNLPFGAKISGLNEESVRDEGVRRQLREIFEDRGLILFEDLVPTHHLQVEIGKVFGPLKQDPLSCLAPDAPRAMPGIVELSSGPDVSDIVEIDGRRYSSWVPWHFDHCCDNELNRAGVLRVRQSPPAGAQTGFLDGIDLYRSLAPALRVQIEQASIVYSMDMRLSQLRFGRPKSLRLLQEDPLKHRSLERARSRPRAIHPAVWTRRSGEPVLHVSAWMAEGIAGRAGPEGDRLLEAVCQEINRLAKSHAYFHAWQPTDMLVWDNWRMLVSNTGCSPPQPRSLYRSTIQGDYGLGRFEG